MLLVLLLFEVFQSLLLGHQLLLLHLYLLLLPRSHLSQLLNGQTLARPSLLVHLILGARPIMHGSDSFVTKFISHHTKSDCFRTPHFSSSHSPKYLKDKQVN